MAVAPGINHYIPLPYGPLSAFLRDPLGFQLQARERFGDVFRFRIGPVVVHFVYHPEHVRRVLHEHQKNYLRGWQYRLLRRLFGENLTVSEGPYWLRQRRLAQPAFHRQRLSEYANVMVEEASSLVSRWQGLAAVPDLNDLAEPGASDNPYASPTSTGMPFGNSTFAPKQGPEERAIEARHEMSRVTLAIASRALFDRDVSHETDEVGQAFGVLGQYFDYRFHHALSSPPMWVPTPMNRSFKKAVSTLNRIVTEIVRERLREGTDHGDLLSRFIQACDEETGERMTHDQLRSEVLTFLLAGHETTATALTWIWYLLASNGPIRQRVREEVKTVIGDRPPTAADAPQLDLTRAVIQEAMRLYPPIWIIPRHVVANDEIGGFRIPARSTVVLCPYVTHRHPAFWEAPDVFDPDRFTTERSAGRPKEAYFPFLSGPHQCIGNEFAMLAMQLVVARVIQAFDVTLRPGQAVKPAASLGLWPDGPVWLAISRQA